MNTVRVLVEYGADVHTTPMNETTHLYVAAEVGHDDVIDVVIEWGADMNTRDASLNTALHVAA